MRVEGVLVAFGRGATSPRRLSRSWSGSSRRARRRPRGPRPTKSRRGPGHSRPCSPDGAAFRRTTVVWTADAQRVERTRKEPFHRLEQYRGRPRTTWTRHRSRPVARSPVHQSRSCSCPRVRQHANSPESVRFMVARMPIPVFAGVRVRLARFAVDPKRVLLWRRSRLPPSPWMTQGSPRLAPRRRRHEESAWSHQ